MRSFLQWWFAQLASLLPSRLFRAWRNNDRLPTLEIHADTLILSGGKGKDELELPLTKKDPLQAELELPPPFAKKLNALRVRLHPDEFMLRWLTLPASAKNHLREAVGYQLPKLTPFSLPQVVYACGMQEGGQTNDSHNVWLLVVPRHKLSTALGRLGLTKNDDAIEIEGPPGRDDWLEFVWRFSPARKGRFRTSRALSLGALLVFVTAAALHLFNKQQTVELYAAELAALGEEVSAIEALKSEIQAITNPVSELNQRRSESISSLQLLNTLSREIGDDTWLQNLDLKGTQLTIRGLSSNPAGLIQLLEAQPAFEDVRFESAITQDTRRQQSRFTIRANILPPAQPEEGT